MRKYISQVLLLTLILITPAHALTKLFYTLRDSDIPNLRDHYRVLSDINQHHKEIDILVPQAYVISKEGYLYKFVNPETKAIAKKYHIKLMPLVTNENFNANKVNQFLNNPTAQTMAIHSLVHVCKVNHYYGLQIDFEHILAHDRNAFTKFYTNTANALHSANCKISIAIVPSRHNIPPSKLLLKRNLYWSGAYDQKRLGGASDFVVLMTYNQSGGMTTPGPTATVPIDEEAIKHALQFVPRNKVFLGIPTTSLYWEMLPTDQAFQHARTNLEQQPALDDDENHSLNCSH